MDRRLYRARLEGMSPITDSLILHTGRSRVASLEADVLAGLLDPEAYPHPVDQIEVIETHISWVLLTGEFAYKIKKPVDLGFLDFRDLERRRFFCEEELRLNRFWAPELYLAVVPIAMRDGYPRVGGEGSAVEYAVRMRQFDQGLRLDNQLEAGRLTGVDMLELAAEIGARHRTADCAGQAGRLLRATKRLMWDNFDYLIGEIAHERSVALHRWTKASLSLYEAKLKERCAEGFYRECHGDLHLGNIVRLPGGIKAFDCIEFSQELRRIDVVADYAFLVMDLVTRDRADLAYMFLNRYLDVSGDYDGVTLLPLYVVYRCLVRAKVVAIRRLERDPGEITDEETTTFEHYVEQARKWTEPRRPVLVVMSGLSGSGKTWLSGRLMAELPALRLRSDLERKRLFGLGEIADSHSGIASDMYRPAIGDAVYGRMFEQARGPLASGFDVILDAAFLNLDHRKQARRLARDCNADFVIVEVTAPLATLEQRVSYRTAAGKDASEANLEVLRHQVETSEPLTADEVNSAVIVNTDSEADTAAVVLALRQRAASD